MIGDHRILPATEPRQTLAAVENTWLHRWEIERARECAETGTEEECAEMVEKLERSIWSSIYSWRQFQ